MSALPPFSAPHSKRKLGDNTLHVIGNKGDVDASLVDQDWIDQLRQQPPTVSEHRGYKVIGNQEGVNIFTEFSDMRSDIASLKYNVKKLNSYLLQIRHSVVEDRRLRTSNGTKDREYNDARVQRNTLVHGGDIINDLEVIRRATVDHPDRRAVDYAGILYAYGITFREAVNVTPTAPQELIKTFDIRASVIELYHWQGIPARQQKVRHIADKIISGWLSKPANERNKAFDAKNGQLAGEFAELLRVFNFWD